MKFLNSFTTKIYADGASLNEILELNSLDYISGFTTNPTLMKKANITDYQDFALQVLDKVKKKPISFEVFSDDTDEMFLQAIKISSWADNVYVKIPITNTKGQPTKEIIKNLSKEGVKLNITAIFTKDQINYLIDDIDFNSPIIFSYFAGRVADSGIDPLPKIKEIIDLTSSNDSIEILWASPREVFNVIQANDAKCHIITVSNELLSKLKNIGKNLDEFSLDTVKMFYNDALNAGYDI